MIVDRLNNAALYFGLGERIAAALKYLNENDCTCLLYTSDAADDLLCVDLGGRRIIKKKT